MKTDPEPIAAEPPGAAADEEGLLDAARRFFLTGAAEGQENRASGGAFVPAALAPFADPTGFRGPYPVLLNGDSVRTLTAAVDELVAGIEADGEAHDRQERVLLRLDRALRKTAGEPESTAEAVARAESSVRESLDRRWKKDADRALERARAALGQGTISGYTDSFLTVLAPTLVGAAYRDAVSDWLDDVEQLEARLRQLIEVDEDERDTETDHVRHVTGGSIAEAFNFDALSSLLEEAPHAATLPPDRHTRVLRCLQTLSTARTRSAEADTYQPVPVADAESVVTRRLAEAAALERVMTAARLESRHRYDAARHAPLLDPDRPDPARDADRRLAPPVVAVLDELTAEDSDYVHAFRLAVGEAPCKLVVVLRHIPDDPAGVSLPWGLLAAARAAADTLTFQGPLSDIEALVAGLTEASRHPGPAVIGVFAPPDYLQAAAAREGRGVPSVLVRPAACRLADRVSLEWNEALDRPWPATDDGTSFTWLDLAAALPSFTPAFLPLPSDAPHDGLHRFGTTPADDTSIPFVPVVSENGEAHLAIPMRWLLRLADRAEARWRDIQELAGISSSLVEDALTNARLLHARGLEDALAEANAAHEVRLGEAVGTLARQIVTNIASSLLGRDTGPVSGIYEAPAPTTVVPAAPPDAGEPDEAAAAPPSAELEPDDDEDGLSLDEAFIETARCTSCNECTDLNGQIFGYNDEKQAFIRDASAGPYRDMVLAAEKCPVAIIHPGPPSDPDETGLDEWIRRAKPFL